MTREFAGKSDKDLFLGRRWVGPSGLLRRDSGAAILHLRSEMLTPTSELARDPEMWGTRFRGRAEKQIPSLRYGMTTKLRCGMTNKGEGKCGDSSCPSQQTDRGPRSLRSE